MSRFGRRIVVLGAGGPAGVNVCRALTFAKPSPSCPAGYNVYGLDSNQHHLVWADPYCAQTFIAPAWDELEQFLAALRVDLVHSQPEQGLPWLAERDQLPSFLPAANVIRDCQAKYTAAMVWHETGLRNHHPYRVFDPYPDTLHLAKDDLGMPFWLRAGTGAGARGATLVEDLRTAFHWIRYWETRGVYPEWIAEEYLPGRDFCWTSVWRDGICYAAFTRERLEWIYPHLAPSGRTGTPTIAVVVHDRRVTDMASRAVVAIDPMPNGIYCVDLREDTNGEPRPTEINVGRFATTSPIYHEIGPNLVDIYVRLSAGEDMEPLGADIYPENVALLRHIDCEHTWAVYDRDRNIMDSAWTPAFEEGTLSPWSASPV